MSRNELVATICQVPVAHYGLVDGEDHSSFLPASFNSCTVPMTTPLTPTLIIHARSTHAGIEVTQHYLSSEGIAERAS